MLHTPASLMRANGRRALFPAVPKGATFEYNGNIWHKVSSRTALLIWPAGPSHSFYFTQRDIAHYNAEW